MMPRGSRLGAHGVAAWMFAASACAGGSEPTPAAKEPAVDAVPVAPAVLLPARPLPDGWVAFEVPELGLQVELPQAPEGWTGKMDASRGPIELRTFKARHGTRAYRVAITDMPGAMRDLGYVEIFTELRAKALAGGEVISEEMRTHEGFPVHHMRFTDTNGGQRIAAEVRTLVAGGRSYQLFAFSPPDDGRSADTERFMASLHLADGACAHSGATDPTPIQVQREPKVGAAYRVRADFNGKAKMRIDATVNVVAVLPEQVELDVEFHALPEYGTPPAGVGRPGPHRLVVFRKRDFIDYEFLGEDADTAEFLKAYVNSYDFSLCTLPAAPHKAGDVWRGEHVTGTLLGVQTAADGKWASFAERRPMAEGPLPPGSMNFPAVIQRVKVDDGFAGRCAIELLLGGNNGKDQRQVRLIEVTRVR